MELNRTEAFLQDKDFFVDDDLGSYAVFGTETGFCYKNGMEKEEAHKYAAELAKNKADHIQFLEIIS